MKDCSSSGRNYLDKILQVKLSVIRIEIPSMSKVSKRAQSDFFIDGDGTPHFLVASIQTAKNVIREEGIWKKIFLSPNPPIKTLFDMREVKLLSLAPFRQKYIEMTALAKTLKKVALLTDSRLLWIFLSFNFNAGKNMENATLNVKPFLSEEDAMKWLKQY